MVIIMSKISVVIPVYNAEEYLEECLNSIVNQTMSDLEIICINDGSTDNSLKILEEFAQKDERIKVISQSNHGQGYTRNKGIELVNTEYFCFVDADDKLELNTFEKCYNVMKNKKLDWVMFQLINLDDTTKEFYTTPAYDMEKVSVTVKNNVFNYKSIGDLIFFISVSPVNKLYNTQFVKKHDIKFLEGMIFEDNIFYWNLIFNTKRAYFLKEYFYIRRVHDKSTIGAGSEKWCDAIDIYNMVWDIFTKYDHFDEFKNILYNNKVDFALFRYENIKEEFKDLFFNKWKNDLINIKNNYNDFVANLNIENKNIYELVLCSDSAKEFDLLRNINSLSNKIYDLELKHEVIKKEYNKLLQNQTNSIEEKIIIKENTISNQKDIKRIDDLTKQNKDLIKKISLLEQEKLKLNNFREEVETSSSWKITRPLRKIMNKLRGIKN